MGRSDAYWDADDNAHPVYLTGQAGPVKAGYSYADYC